MSVYDPEKRERGSLLESPNDDELRRITGIDKDQEEQIDRSARLGNAKEVLDAENRGSEAGKIDRGTDEEAEQLKEASPDEYGKGDNSESSGFFKNEESKKNRKRFRITRKQAAAGGAGVLGIFGIGTIIFLSSTALPFMHMSNLLQGFHFDNNNNVADNRVSRAWNYIRGRSERSNLGALGNRYVDRLEGRLAERGITVEYRNGRIHSMTIDTSNPKNLAAVDELRAKGHNFSGGPVDVTWTADTGTGATSSIRGYLDDFRVSISEEKVVGALGGRLLKAKGGVGFHPLKNFIRDRGDELVKYIKDVRYTRLEAAKTGDPNLGLLDAPTKTEIDARSADVANQRLPDELKGDSPGQIKTNFKLAAASTAGVLGVYTLICAVNDIGDTIEANHFDEVILPLMRLGQEAVSLGSQIQFSDGLNSEEIGALFTRFSGNTDIGTLSAFSADSIQAELGNRQIGERVATQGPNEGETVRPADLPPSSRPGKDKPVIFKFASTFIDNVNFGLGGPLCDFLGTSLPGGFFQIADVIDVAAAFFSGGTSAGIASIVSNSLWVVGGFAAGDLIDNMIRAIGGAALACANGGPKEWGSCVNFGARLASNYNAISSGGRELTPEEEIALDNNRKEIEHHNNKAKSLYARYLDPKNTTSLFTKTALLNPRFSSLTYNNFAYSLRAPLGSLGNVFTNFGNVFSGRASAATVNYEYDFPEFGFSLEEQNDSRWDNPYDNANWIERELPEDEQCESGPLVLNCLNEEYGWNAENESCFNVFIDENGKIVNKYFLDYRKIIKKNETNRKCIDGAGDYGKEGLERLRIYIKDTVTLKGGSCYEGEDEEACSELGFDNGSSSNSDGSGGADIIGDPFSSSVDVDCAEGTEDLGIFDGYVDGERVEHRLCAIPNLPGDEDAVPGANGKAVVNSRVSGAVYAMAEDGPNLSIVSSFRTMEKQQQLWDAAVARGDCPGIDCAVAEPGQSNHQNGTALDFNIGTTDAVDNTRTCEDRMRWDESPMWLWLFENAENYGYTQLSYEAWHWDPSTGPKKCNSSQP